MKSMSRTALVLLLVFVMSTPILISQNTARATAGDKVFVGVTFGGTTVKEAEQLIDKVRSCTNLFVVDSWTIDGAFNSSADLDEICDYAVNAGLSVMVYFSFIYYNYSFSFGNLYNSSTWDLYGVSPWHVDWLNQAKARYGDKFLGAYLYDEPGGKQTDLGYWGGNMTTFTGARITSFDNTTNYDDAANRFTRGILTSGSMQHIINSSIPNSITSPLPVFTSDYALYWFDYKAGYSTVFVELGGNLRANDKIEQIALCRGAATAQNKDWGTIVTLATDKPPTPQDGSTVLNDMTMAYEAGAKYILVFNYYGNSGQGSLTDEQFNAMKQFWDNIHSSSSDSYGKFKGQVALVLPTNYGWGMRSINDKIWGHWPADNNSVQIWDNMNKLIAKYGLNLDIVYDDPQVNIQGLHTQTYLWNETLNFATEPSLSNEVYIIASVLAPVGAIACFSTYWLTKSRKKKPATLHLQESNPNQQVFMEQPIKTPEKVEPRIDLNGIFNSFADTADPLFDLLMNLHGRVDWNSIENSLEQYKLAKLQGVKAITENLNSKNLFCLIKTYKPNDVSHETGSLIQLLHANVLALGSEEPSEKAQAKYSTLKSAVLSYFMFNDVLLGQVTGDKEIGKEKIELADTLDGFSRKARVGLFTGFTYKLRREKNGVLAVDESRALLREHLNEFLNRF